MEVFSVINYSEFVLWNMLSVFRLGDKACVFWECAEHFFYEIDEYFLLDVYAVWKLSVWYMVRVLSKIKYENCFLATNVFSLDEDECEVTCLEDITRDV